MSEEKIEEKKDIVETRHGVSVYGESNNKTNFLDESQDQERKQGKEVVEPIIKAKNLDFVYNPGKGNEFHALHDVSFEINSEEFIIIFGPSGCGKSTLLNVIAGLEAPDKGSIFVFGQDLTKMNSYDFAVYHRRHVGMIYQSYNLITSLTVLENVVLPQMFVNVRRGRRKRWGRELLKRFGIIEHADKIPTELSGGQQQRIGIARSIVNNPKMVLADEPVGNLDSKSAKLVLDILGDLNTKEKKTIILVTHNPEYLDHADRILYMKDGIITHEVINEKKKNDHSEIEKPKTSINKISELMRAYQGMTPDQINILIMPFKSKIFANHFITSLSMEEMKIFEEAIQRRMLGTLSEDDFFEILDKPARDGGVGFDKRTARRIIRRINRAVRMAYFIYQKGHQSRNESGVHDKVTIDEKVKKIVIYLYKTCYKEYYNKLKNIQNERMEKAVKERIENIIDKNIFKNYLDKSFKDGGVGLNRKTAKTIGEELELVLILGFGVVGVSEKIENMHRSSREIKQIQQEVLNVPKSDRGTVIIRAKKKDKKTPSPGDILSQMKSQLDQKVKTVNSDVRAEDNKILEDKESCKKDLASKGKK